MRLLSALRRRAAEAVGNYFRRELTAEHLINCEEVPRYVRDHLSQFYLVLLCTSLSSAVGSWFHFTDNLRGLLTAFVTCGSFVSFYNTDPWRERKRLGFFMLTAYCGFAAATPWISWFLYIDTGFVATIILAHSAGFASLYASCKWTGVFQFVYAKAQFMYAILLAATLYATSTVFGGDSDEFKYLIYPYLMWSMGYVAAYSQEVVVRARKGDLDFVKQAFCLYPDFPSFLATLVKELCRLGSNLI